MIPDGRPAGETTAGAWSRGEGRVAELSRQAIRYAVHLHRLETPADVLSQALYDFNRLPLAEAPDVADPVALADAVEAELEAGGQPVSARYRRSLEAESRWIYWMRRDETFGGRLRHKLYVSPTLPALRATLALTRRLADAHGVRSFKLGLDGHGVRRSDKLVVYFPEPDARSRFAEDFLHQAKGLEAHGVPLTRPLDATGLISSAEDPLLGDLSWRQLISVEIVDILVAWPPGPVDESAQRVWAELDRRGLMSGLQASA